MIKVDYIVVSFIVYTSGDMLNNLQNARKRSRLLIVNKKIVRDQKAKFRLRSVFLL